MSNKITCNNYVYEDSDIFSGNCNIGNSLAGEELSIDTLDVSLNISSDPIVFAPSDYDEFQSKDGETLLCTNSIDEYAYGDVMQYEYNDDLIGKFYVEKPVRTGKTRYDFSCTSTIGLLDNITHYGGIYVRSTAGSIISNIMGDIPYTINADVSTVLVNGWLPVATCRENLQQVLFSVGATIYKDSSGDIFIKFIALTDPTAIDDSRIYLDGSVDYKTPCTRVDVTEHAYHALSGDNVVTLFDTVESATSQMILFDNPCHDLSVTGLTLNESGVNYAIVSGTGSLTGKEYTHTKRVESYSTGITGAENIVSVTDATLISAFNSYNVALRVAQYYSEVSEDSIGLVVGEERPPDIVSFTDPFSEPKTGYIKSMDIAMSAILKADTIIAVGFLPEGHGNYYNNYVIVTADGTWTVPTGVDQIRIIVIGGGSGGADGADGGTSISSLPGGNVPLSWGGLAATAGGVGGTGGTSGKIFITTAEVTPGQNFSVSIGSAGASGGGSGGETAFGSYSSADGSVSESGFYEIMTGTAYAMPGDDGVDGGDGGTNDVGEDAGGYSGGLSCASASGSLGWWFYSTYYSCDYVRGGHGGGGAAFGNNGGNAVRVLPTGGGTTVIVNAYGGYPGAGANAASVSDATAYGSGGPGGHGGGGNGNYGSASYTNPSSPAPSIASGSIWAYGGTGSAGGAGAQGCVIIYY